MSYDLFLRFTPSLARERLGQFLGTRHNYSSSEGRIAYSNPLTGVYFNLQTRGSGLPIWGNRVREARFEINYGRPSYFALEADIELKALIDSFGPKIEDPQTRGMGAGPYTTDGFLRGWSFGNDLLASTLIRDGVIGDRYRFPASVLHRVWEWNYRRGERMAQLAGLQFFPEIGFQLIDGRACLVAVWGEAMPIVLPKVDYVLVGRFADGERRFHLAAWTEVIDVVARAGIGVEKTPLDICYKDIPEPIARWVAEMPVDAHPRPRLEPEQLLDDEAVARAERICAGEAGVSILSFAADR